MGIFSSKDAQDVIDRLHMDDSSNDKSDDKMIPWVPKLDLSSAQSPRSATQRPRLNTLRREQPQHASRQRPDNQSIPRAHPRRDGTPGNPYHIEAPAPGVPDYNRPALNSRYLEMRHSQSLDSRSRDRGTNLSESHPYQRDGHASYTSPVRQSSSAGSPDDRHSNSMLPQSIDIRSQALAKVPAHAYSTYLHNQTEALNMQHRQLVVNNSVAREAPTRGDVRRSSSHESLNDASGITKDPSYLVAPNPGTMNRGANYDWRRPSHISPASISQPAPVHAAHQGRAHHNIPQSPRHIRSPRASMTSKPSSATSKQPHSPSASRDTDYSPPLDLSFREVPRKRTLAEMYGEDQPLDLSVKQQKKTTDESDDDVILVGVQNLKNPVPSSPASNELAPGFNQWPIPIAHHRNLAHTRPPGTQGTCHQPTLKQHTPNTYNSIPSKPGARTPANKRLPNDQRAHASRSTERPPYLSYHSQCTQSRNNPSQLHVTQPAVPSGSANPQGIPLTWGIDHRSPRSDNKSISTPAAHASNPDGSPYDDSSKARLESTYSRSNRESRAGPPEAYQDLANQERHIQRIDKYKEHGSADKSSDIMEVHQFSPMTSSSPCGWYARKGYLEPRQSKPSSPDACQKSPKATSSSLVAENTQRDKPPPYSPYSSGAERAVYLDKVPMPVRFIPSCIPFDTPSMNIDIKTSASESVVRGEEEPRNNVNSSIVKDIPDVKDQPQSKVSSDIVVPYVPKYVAPMHGNQVYQCSKTDAIQMVAIRLPDNIIQSTVAAPVPLAAEHGSQVASVPIIKEENIIAQVTDNQSDKNQTDNDKDTVRISIKHSKYPEPDPGARGSPTVHASQNVISSTATTDTKPVLSPIPTSQPQGNPNMVSKTESKFVSAANKMIPVANVHPIVKSTPEILPKSEEPKIVENSGQDDSKDESTSLDSKKVELLKQNTDAQQKIQITPNPLFSSHQDEFVRFLSRSNTDPLPQFPRFSKKQLNILAKTGLNKMGTALYTSHEEGVMSPELQGKLAAEFREMERVRRNLALHFMTPKGRHKLLAKRSTSSKDGDLSDATETILGEMALHKSTDVEPGNMQSDEAKVKDNDVPKKPKVPRKRRAKKDGQEKTDATVDPDKPRAKKRRSKKMDVSTSVAGDAAIKLEGGKPSILAELLVEPGAASRADVKEVQVQRKRWKKTAKSDNAEVTPEKTRRLKKRCKILVSESPKKLGGKHDSTGRKVQGKKHNRSKSPRAELRQKCKDTSIYDKNAAYEAELRKEEERRLIRRVNKRNRKERCHVSVPLTRVDADEHSMAFGYVTEDSNVDDDAPHVTDDVRSVDNDVVEDGEESPTPRVARPRLKKSKKLSFKNRLGAKKKALPGQTCYTSAMPVEQPLHPPRRVKPKRLPMMKVTRRRIKRDARDAVKCSGDGADKKRLFVCRETGETALHKAARKGYVEVALQCLDSGALDVNVRDNAGYTPLHESSVSGNLVIAKALIARGADASVKALDGTRPLHDAVDNNHVELVRLLLSHGADPTIANYGGRTPLKLARSTNMKAIMTDHLADLRDEGPEWELPAFVGKQGHELGFDILDGAPCGDDDVDCDVFIDLSATDQPQVFFLNIDKKIGPRNYHLVDDVCQRLGQDNKEDFILLNGDLHFTDTARDDVITQVRSNVFNSVDASLPETLEDRVQLVEIDSVLCQMLDVNREHMSIRGTSDQHTKGTPRGSDTVHCTVDENKAGPSSVLTDSNSLPNERISDSNGCDTTDMRKSKSCTSLDYCGLGVSGLQLSGLNRSDSSPNVKQPCVSTYKKRNPTQVKTSAKSVKSDRDKKRKDSSKRALHPECTNVKIILPRAISDAMLCNDVIKSVTMPGRETKKLASARKGNKTSMHRTPNVSIKRTASKNPTELNKCAADAESLQVNMVSEKPKPIPISYSDETIARSSETMTTKCNPNTDSDSDKLVIFGASLEVIGGGSDQVGNSGYDSDTEVESADDEVASVPKSPTDDRHISEDETHSKSGAQDEPPPSTKTSEALTLAASKSHGGDSVIQEGSAPVNTEPTLPVLESTFEENKGVPDVTNEECSQEEREMPELTPCTY